MFVGRGAKLAFQFSDFWETGVLSERQILSYGLCFACDMLLCSFML